MRANTCKNIFFKIRLVLLIKNWDVCFFKNFNKLYASHILYFYGNFNKLKFFSKIYVFFFIFYHNTTNVYFLRVKELKNCNIYHNNFYIKKLNKFKLSTHSHEIYQNTICSYFFKKFNINNINRILNNLGFKKINFYKLSNKNNLYLLIQYMFLFKFNPNKLIFLKKNKYKKPFFTGCLYFKQYIVFFNKYLADLNQNILKNLINISVSKDILINLRFLKSTLVRKLKTFKNPTEIINFDVRYTFDNIWSIYDLITFKKKVFFYEWAVLLNNSQDNKKLPLKIFFINQLNFILQKITLITNLLNQNILLKCINNLDCIDSFNDKNLGSYFYRNLYNSIQNNSYFNKSSFVKNNLNKMYLFNRLNGNKFFKKIKHFNFYKNNFYKNWNNLNFIELFFKLNLKFYQNVLTKQLVCNSSKELVNMFTFFKFIQDLLFNEDPVLKFYDFLKYMTNIGKYIMTHYYPKNFFYCFINFVHHKRFNALDESLNSVLYSKYSYLFKKSYINYKYIFEIFYNTFKYKNINFLVTFLIDLFKNVNFYKHQFLLFYIRCFMKLLNLPLFNEFNVNGIFIKFHGKIAKAGNSRRKKFLLQHNVISTAYKNNYIVEKFQLHSFTGVVGCTLILSFN